MGDMTSSFSCDKLLLSPVVRLKRLCLYPSEPRFMSGSLAHGLDNGRFTPGSHIIKLLSCVHVLNFDKV